MTAHSASVCCYSDLLCVWAYVAQIRLDELRRNFGDRVEIEHRFVPVFGDTATKIGTGWAGRGGYPGYAPHVREVVDRFDHAELHPEVWIERIPAGSLGPHAFVKAVQLLAEAGEIDPPPAGGRGRPVDEELMWRLRLAFFGERKNIARFEVQSGIAESLGLPGTSILERLRDGSALAALARDHESALEHGISGSPTFLLNEGRQTLYGNVGYRILEANVQELLEDNSDKASWC